MDNHKASDNDKKINDDSSDLIKLIKRINAIFESKGRSEENTVRLASHSYIKFITNMNIHYHILD